MKLLIRGDEAICDLEAFKALRDYTRSQPTGPKPGTRWKRRINWHQPNEVGIWQLGEAVQDPDPAYIIIKYRPLEVVK